MVCSRISSEFHPDLSTRAQGVTQALSRESRDSQSGAMVSWSETEAKIALPLWTGRIPQCSQRIRKLFDTGFLHQILRFACLLKVAPDNQPVHVRVDVRQIVWCGTTANENRQGRMLADNGNIFRARRSTGIIARHNDSVSEPRSVKSRASVASPRSANGVACLTPASAKISTRERRAVRSRRVAWLVPSMIP